MFSFIIDEILHWLFQRGDSISATRLCMSLNYKSQIEFEKPLVVVGAKLYCEGETVCEYIYKTFQNVPKILDRTPVQLIKSYSGGVRKICGIIYKFTPGNITDLRKLFYNASFLDTRWDLKNVKILSNSFRNCEIPNAYWNLESLECACSAFHCSKLNFDINWNVPKLKFANGMFKHSTFCGKFSIISPNLKIANEMFYWCPGPTSLEWNTINLQSAIFVFDVLNLEVVKALEEEFPKHYILTKEKAVQNSVDLTKNAILHFEFVDKERLTNVTKKFIPNIQNLKDSHLAIRTTYDEYFGDYFKCNHSSFDHNVEFFENWAFGEGLGIDSTVNYIHSGPKILQSHEVFRIS